MSELRRTAPARPAPNSISATDAVSYLHDIAALWSAQVSDEARAQLLHAIYERIVATATAS